MFSYPQSLQDGNHRRHHAELTEVGRAKLKANKRYHHDCGLFPGIDYRVKGEPDPRWLSFPDIPSTQHFRHMWIIEKRCRPVAPVFVGSPVCNETWWFVRTLCLVDNGLFSSIGVKKGWCARRSFTVCWKSAQMFGTGKHLATWLDGNVICKESARYIRMILKSVPRTSTWRDPNDDARSDEDFSDEELFLTEEALSKQCKLEWVDAALQRKQMERVR